ASLLQGKQLSYNNINDTDAAYELFAEFLPEKAPACSIIKHANPCGIIVIIAVVTLLAASPESGKTILGLDPLFGLDPQ
ncbi:hypothetical protein ACC681_38560, partial [Rhizobium ruizarguesonis]